MKHSAVLQRSDESDIEDGQKSPNPFFGLANIIVN